MKLLTYYKIYYEHRIKKANILLKLYIYLIIPFRYFYNLIYLPRKKNLDLAENQNRSLRNLDLSSLFDYFNSDKGESFEDQYIQPFKRTKKKIKGHGYAKYYEENFKNFKNQSISLLEIGSFHGNAAAAFFFYFDKAKIYSGDIFPDLFRYKSKRIFSFYVNSSDEISIKNNILNNNLQFEIIIEDASHSLKDQIISLFMLFKSLKSKGIFIIEELDFPDTRDDMNLNKEKTTLKKILNCIINNKDFYSKYISKEEKEYFLHNYESIDIYKGNFNEVAIIKKK